MWTLLKAGEDEPSWDPFEILALHCSEASVGSAGVEEGGGCGQRPSAPWQAQGSGVGTPDSES